jgi:hypothetical protein
VVFAQRSSQLDDLGPVVLIVLDLRRTEAKVPTDATEAAAVSVLIGAVP